jgi:hypothetical protein
VRRRLEVRALLGPTSLRSRTGSTPGGGRLTPPDRHPTTAGGRHAPVDGDAEVACAHLDALDHLVMDRDLLLAAGGVGLTGYADSMRIDLAAAAAGDELIGIRHLPRQNGCRGRGSRFKTRTRPIAAPLPPLYARPCVIPLTSVPASVAGIRRYAGIRRRGASSSGIRR